MVEIRIRDSSQRGKEARGLGYHQLTRYRLHELEGTSDDNEVRVISNDDLLDLSDFDQGIGNGEAMRVAWLDPESHDYVETVGRVEVRALDGGGDQPVIYRILRVQRQSDDGDFETVELVNVSSDGKISRVDDEVSLDGVIVTWRPGPFSRAMMNDGSVVTVRSSETMRMSGDVEAVRVTPVIGESFMTPLGLIRRMMVTGADSDGR